MTVVPPPATADHRSLALAAGALSAGSVVAVPTDTVYGLAADPFVPTAVESLFTLKERPSEVPVPVLVATWEQVDAVAGRLSPEAGRLAHRYWPGPLTLVVPRRAGFAADLGGSASARRTVGVRWPDHRLVQALCKAVGPLAVTSANRHGVPPATTAAEVARVFEGARCPAVILDGGECDRAPSTVVVCQGSSSRCLRHGAIAWDEIRGVLELESSVDTDQ